MTILRVALLALFLPLVSAGTCGGDDPDACDVDADRDDDGHVDVACDGDDCDDTDGERFPGNSEVCDSGGHDEDCDPTTFGVLDADGDDALDARCCNLAPSGEFECGDDCDDGRTGVHPGAPEVCDLFDDDCDGAVDEGVLIDLYDDGDGDGHGAGSPTDGCFLTPGVSYLSNDCDDTNPAIVPGAQRCLNASDYEICQEDGDWSLKATCPGQGCVAQPNGTGICI